MAWWDAFFRDLQRWWSKIRIYIPPVQITLYFYNNEPSKNKHFLNLFSIPAMCSQKPKLKRIFEILWVLFEKISVFYSYWPKSSWEERIFHFSNIFFFISIQNYVRGYQKSCQLEKNHRYSKTSCQIAIFSSKNTTEGLKPNTDFCFDL